MRTISLMSLLSHIKEAGHCPRGHGGPALGKQEEEEAASMHALMDQLRVVKSASCHQWHPLGNNRQELYEIKSPHSLFSILLNSILLFLTNMLQWKQYVQISLQSCT